MRWAAIASAPPGCCATCPLCSRRCSPTTTRCPARSGSAPPRHGSCGTKPSHPRCWTCSGARRRPTRPRGRCRRWTTRPVGCWRSRATSTERRGVWRRPAQQRSRPVCARSSHWRITTGRPSGVRERPTSPRGPPTPSPASACAAGWHAPARRGARRRRASRRARPRSWPSSPPARPARRSPRAWSSRWRRSTATWPTPTCKLGVRNRAEATAWAIAHGLHSPVQTRPPGGAGQVGHI